jgi:hypothetical protein
VVCGASSLPPQAASSVAHRSAAPSHEVPVIERRAIVVVIPGTAMETEGTRRPDGSALRGQGLNPLPTVGFVFGRNVKLIASIAIKCADENVTARAVRYGMPNISDIYFMQGSAYRFAKPCESMCAQA